jgi:L-galactose dehydrogenase
MQRRELGKTGLVVSAVGYGASSLGGAFGAVTVDAGVACVRHAIDAGINFVDVSPYYGATKAEFILGRALADGWRNRVILSSKAGRIADDRFDFSSQHLERSVDDSLRRLGTDYLDILLAHDVEFAQDFDQVFGETANTLQQLKRKGKARFVGMSAYPLGLLEQVIRRCQVDVVLSYCHYCLLDTRLVDRLLDMAEAHGVGVINASPLAMGLLSEHGPPSWHPAPPELRQACANAFSVCRRRGASLSFLALQFALQQERLPTTLVGTSRSAEIDAAVSALATPIDQDLLVQVQAVLSPVKNRGWSSGNWRECES